MKAETGRFDSVLLEAINETLLKVFGPETSRSVQFYIDPSIALVDPSAYANSLKRMFQDGAKVVLEEIIATLCKKTGLPESDFENFGDAVSSVKHNLK